MKRKIILFALILTLTLTLAPPPSHALWWMIYHKPEFKGKVLDAETKAPIEGAVVVVTYNKKVIRIAPESMSEIVDVREALTDKEGSFDIPSYTTVIDPLAWETSATFIVFKPGYAAVPGWNLEEHLSQETAQEVELPWIHNKELKFRFAPGIVELPKLKTREERLNAFMSVPIAGLPSRKMQNLIRLFNEEAVSLGLAPISLP